MRHPIVPVAVLVFALASGSALATPEKAAPTKPTQAKSGPVKPGSAPVKAPRSKSELKSVGMPVVKESVLTPEQVKAQQAEWKKLEDREVAERKVRRERFKEFLASYAKEGLDFKRGDKPDTYRLIAPSMAKTTDPAQRKAAARALVTRIKGQLEPILRKKITLDVYSDAKSTQKIAF